MSFKNIANTIIIDAYRKLYKGNVFLDLLLDSRKEFVEYRILQESHIEEQFNFMRRNLLYVLNNKVEEFDETGLETILNYLNDFTVDLRLDLNRVINKDIKGIIETGSNPYKEMFEYLTEKYKLKRVSNSQFNKAIDKKNGEVVAYISNKQYGTRSKNTMKLSGRIWKSSLYAKTGIIKVLRNGLNKGLSVNEMAKQLNKYMTPSARNTILKKEIGKKFPSNPHYYAKRVARTEAQHSYQKSMYESGQVMPSYEGIIWVLSNRHPKYDICDKIANETKYGEKGFYPKGKEPIVPHPQCICTQIQKLENNDDFIDRLIAWDEGKKDKKLDNWYKNYIK